MPRAFYHDINRNTEKPDEDLCMSQTNFWDGPGVCARPKGHGVNSLKTVSAEHGSFHQEAFEGWVWDDDGSIS